MIRTLTGKGAPPSEAVLPFSFAPRRWHHVVVAHSPGGPLSAPLASLYVDGQLAAAAEKLRYPKARLLARTQRGCWESKHATCLAHS